MHFVLVDYIQKRETLTYNFDSQFLCICCIHCNKYLQQQVSPVLPFLDKICFAIFLIRLYKKHYSDFFKKKLVDYILQYSPESLHLTHFCRKTTVALFLGKMAILWRNDL